MAKREPNPDTQYISATGVFFEEKSPIAYLGLTPTQKTPGEALMYCHSENLCAAGRLENDREPDETG